MIIGYDSLRFVKAYAVTTSLLKPCLSSFCLTALTPVAMNRAFSIFFLRHDCSEARVRTGAMYGAWGMI